MVEKNKKVTICTNCYFLIFFHHFTLKCTFFLTNSFYCSLEILPEDFLRLTSIYFILFKKWYICALPNVSITCNIFDCVHIRTNSPSLAASLEPLVHHWNVASLSLLYRYYFGWCSSQLAQLAPLPFSWGRSTCYSDIPCTARLWNSLPIECFPLTCNWNGFN